MGGDPGLGVRGVGQAVEQSRLRRMQLEAGLQWAQTTAGEAGQQLKFRRCKHTKVDNELATTAEKSRCQILQVDC